MMGIETIHRMNREAAERAAKQNRRPAGMTLDDWHSDLVKLDAGQKPRWSWVSLAPGWVQELYPDEYEKIETFFVDKAGASNTGPAMGSRELIHEGLRLTGEHGTTLYWTIHSEGQFQLFVTAFKKNGQDGH